jgi:hypothetical protein
MKALLRWLVVLALLGGGGWWAWQRHQRRLRDLDVVLGDGSVLRLESVQHGARHFDPFAPVWAQLSARMPDSWRKQLPIPQAQPLYADARVTNYLSLWFSWTGQPKTPGEMPFALRVADDAGNAMSLEAHRGTARFLDDGQWSVGFPVANLPRRARQLRVQLLGASTAEPQAEWRIENPLHDPDTPPWRATNWPVTVRDGDLEFSLSALRVGVPNTSWGSVPNSRQTLAEFHVTRAGVEQTDWLAYHVEEIRDATGNRTDGNAWNHDRTGDVSWIRFGESPPPLGEAWRLRVEFTRRAGFASNELWVVRHVPVDLTLAEGRFVSPPVSGKTLSLVALRSRGSPNSGGQSELEVGISPDRKGHQLTLVAATDEQGRRVSVTGGSGTDQMSLLTLDLKPDAQFVDFTLALHPGRFIEFVAEASRWGETNAPAAEPTP